MALNREAKALTGIRDQLINEVDQIAKVEINGLTQAIYESLGAQPRNSEDADARFHPLEEKLKGLIRECRGRHESNALNPDLARKMRASLPETELPLFDAAVAFQTKVDEVVRTQGLSSKARTLPLNSLLSRIEFDYTICI